MPRVCLGHVPSLCASCWNVGFAGDPVHCERTGGLGATAGAGEMAG